MKTGYSPLSSQHEWEALCSVFVRFYEQEETLNSFSGPRLSVRCGEQIFFSEPIYHLRFSYKIQAIFREKSF